MNETPQQPVTVAEVARVGIDLPCITCGYNLRSLPMGGRCPECNSTIESALHHGWLMFADPRWLRRLRSGVTLILWTLLAAVLNYIGFMVTLNIMFTASSGAPDELFTLAPYVVIGVGIAAVWLVSAFKLTMPEPTHVPDGRSRRGTLAKWALAMSILPIFSVIITAFRIGLMITDFSPFEMPNSVFALSAIGGHAADLASMVGLFLLMILMRRISRRVPRSGLGKLMSVLIWGTVGLCVGRGMMMSLFELGVARFLGVSRLLSTTFFVVLGSAVLGWVVCSVVALLWFRRVFSRAITQNAAHQIESVGRQ